MWMLTHAFFAETFQPMNAAVIGLNHSARAFRGKFTFAGAWESCRGIRTICIDSACKTPLAAQWRGYQVYQVRFDV